MKRTILKNAQIILLDQKRMMKGSVVFNAAGQIESVGPDPVTLDEETQVIDCQNKYIIPGLINAHAHLFSSGKPLNVQMPAFLTRTGYKLLQTSAGKALLRKIMHNNAQTQLQSGVTTLRSVGEFFYQDVRLRDWYEKGEALGPTLQVSGFFLTTTDGHGAPYLALEGDSPWEGRKNVRKNLRQGIDWIKICVTGGVTDALRIGEAGALQLTQEEVEAICEKPIKWDVWWQPTSKVPRVCALPSGQGLIQLNMGQ